MKLPRNEILVGDAKEILECLPENSVDMSICSPPYWGLRDYGEESVTVWGGDPNCEHQWGDFDTYHDNLRFRDPNDSAAVGNNANPEIYSNPERDQGICVKCGAWKGQLGLEPTPDLFVKHLVTIFEKLKKPLKPWGTLYVVISDTYNSQGTEMSRHWDGREKNLDQGKPKLTADKISPKCLLMIPERFAMTMINNGWILRNKTIWHKPNPMPSSVKDRLNTTWEYVYMFAQRKKYWWNLDAIREPHKEKKPCGMGEKTKKQIEMGQKAHTEKMEYHPKGKNPGNVQETKKISPQDLIKAVYHRMDRDSKTYKGKNRLETDNTDKIEAYDGRKIRETAREVLQELGIGKDPDLVEFIHDHFSHPKGKNPGDVFRDKTSDESYKGEYAMRNAPEPGQEHAFHKKGKNPGDYWNISTKPFPKAHFAVYPPSLCKKPIKAGCPKKVCQKCGKPKIKKPDFKNIPVCRCDEPEWKNGVVLDPFAGAGSTWVMARKLGRDFLGIEIVEEYAEMARERIPDARLDKFL